MKKVFAISNFRTMSRLLDSGITLKQINLMYELVESGIGRDDVVELYKEMYEDRMARPRNKTPERRESRPIPPNNHNSTSQSILSTPQKTDEGYTSNMDSRKDSPRTRATPRKSYTPRKRDPTADFPFSAPNSEPPSESGSSLVGDDLLSDHVHVNGDALVEELINHPGLCQKVAQSINQEYNADVLSSETDYICSSEYFDSACIDTLPEPSSQDKTLSDDTNVIEANEIQVADVSIENILGVIENDPIFSDVLKNLAAKKDMAIVDEAKASPAPTSVSSISSLSTPKNFNSRSPLTTPNRHLVTKDLMKFYPSPEKKETPSSPLSIAIASSAINCSSFSSPVAPVLDFNFLLNSSTTTTTNVSTQALQTLVPSTDPRTGETTYLIAQTPSTPMSDPVLSAPCINSMNRKVLRSKRLNLAKFEHYNSIGLKRKAERALQPAPVGVRKLAPKLVTTVERVEDDPKAHSEPILGPKRPKRPLPIAKSARCNLRKKFEANLNDKLQPQPDQAHQLLQQQQQQTVYVIKLPDPPASLPAPGNENASVHQPPNTINSQLLKNMNVDQFLSKLHDK